MPLCSRLMYLVFAYFRCCGETEAGGGSGTAPRWFQQGLYKSFCSLKSSSCSEKRCLPFLERIARGEGEDERAGECEKLMVEPPRPVIKPWFALEGGRQEGVSFRPRDAILCK